MSKRKAVHFDPSAVGDGNHDDDDIEMAYAEALKEKVPRVAHKERRFKEKHSLDSDEEDDAQDERGELNDEEEDAQEDGDVDYKEGVQITPFNMKEEMEEGHFDKNGMYIFDKNKGEVSDGWLDNIDWLKIKERNEKKEADGQTGEGEEGEEEYDPGTFDMISAYKQMLELMKPGESVLKAIRRLGGGTKNKASSASQRWKKPKPGAAKDSNPQPEADKAGMLKLTGFADELLANGQLEIYQDTFEKLTFLVKRDADKVTEKVTQAAEDRVTPADDLDIFSDDKQGTSNGAVGDNAVAGESEDMFADESKGATDDTAGSNQSASSSAAAAQTTDSGVPEVMWEYKWKESDSEIHGPFSSTEMLAWQEDGFFKDGAFCRKVKDQQGQFYSVTRIDFDLYT